MELTIRVLSILCFVIAGLVLDSAEISYRNWQFWVVLGLLGAAHLLGGLLVLARLN